MLEAVKVLRTKGTILEVKGDVSDELMIFLRNQYGDMLSVLDVEDQEELVNPKESAWYTETEKTMSPGVYLSIYRDNSGMTQAQLAEKLGVTRFRISDMERDVRGISKETAKKLSELFGVPVERFI